MKKSEFKKLQAEWYEKLKESGFYDIETQKSENCNVVMPEVITLRSLKSVEKSAYFHLLVEFANQSRFFPRALDQWVFRQWLRGQSYRAIAEMNYKTKRFDEFTHHTVARSVTSTLKRIGFKKNLLNDESDAAPATKIILVKAQKIN